MAEIIDVIMRLQDNVTDKLARIRSGMEQTARANERMGRNIANAGKGIATLGAAMMPMTAGIVTAGTLGVKTFADFDAVITAAGVKAGATAGELDKMRETAAKIGATFPISAREAAAGMDRLAAGGFNAAEAIGAMPGIVEAAIASGEDLAATSDVITSALSIWNLKTGDIAANTTHVADVVQAAANASKLGMQEFGIAMQYAGAPAAALGVSIEELGTAMGIMSNNGIEASTIGTSLRATMSRLAKPPKEAAEAISRLGVKVTDASGKFLGLEKIVSQMRTSMSGLNNVQQVALAKAIAGEDAYSGLLALIKTSPEEYRKMANAISNSSGSSHAAYLKMQDTLKGSLDALMSSLEALGISFGAALAPTVRAAANELKFLADTFTNISLETRQLIINAAGIAIGFTGVSLVTGKLVAIGGSLVTLYGNIGRVMAGGAIHNKALQFAVQGVMRAFSLLRVASVAMLGPWGIVIAAIVGAGIYIRANWDRIGPFFVGLWARIKGAFAAAIAMISPAIEKLSNTWHNLTSKLQGGGKAFAIIGGAARALAGILGGILYGAVILVSGVITGVLTFAFSVIGRLVSAAIGVLSGLIEFITGVFTGNWSQAWQGVVDIFSNIFGGVTAICNGVLDGVRAAINSIIDGINSISVDVPDWVPGLGGQQFGPLNVPHLYTGTNNWRGGAAAIHDRGAEIVDLPSGSRVIPHSQSLRQSYEMGAKANRLRTGGGINISIGGVTINNGGDVKAFARQLAEQIYYEMEKEAINSTVGAI